MELPILQPNCPPCLDHAEFKTYDEALGNGKADIALALGLYCKSHNPGTWEKDWRNIVDRYFPDQSLPLDVMVKVRDKIIKAEHPREAYPCKALPFCDKTECGKRKHGSFHEAMVKLPDRLQLWRGAFFLAHYGDHAVWIDADDITDPKVWAKKIGGKGLYTGVPTQAQWDAHMTRLYQSIEVLDVPYEETPEGHFYDWFVDWVDENAVRVGRNGDTYTVRHRGKPQKRTGSPFYDKALWKKSPVIIDDMLCFLPGTLHKAKQNEDDLRGFSRHKVKSLLAMQFDAEYQRINGRLRLVVIQMSKFACA